MASIGSSISNLFAGLTNIVQGLIGSIVAVFASLFNIVYSTLHQLFNAVLHTVTGITSTAGNVSGDLLGIITSNIVLIGVLGGAFVLFTVFAGGNKDSVSKSKKRS